MSLRDKVNFDHLRYANVWEDAGRLLDALAVLPGKRMASIASAGDNVFALLVKDPEVILAFDINPVQLYLCQLKAAAIRTLTREEVIGFLGFTSCENRLELFGRLEEHLSPEALEYWRYNSGQIRSGIIHQGKFERYFRLFAHRILPLIHRKRTIARLFEEKTVAEQQEFYDRNWNTWRWRLFFRIFFSRAVMGKKGRDPEFLRQVEGRVSSYIFGQAEKQLKSKAAQTNPMLYYTLNGDFGPHLPLYLQAAYFEIVRTRLDRIEWQLGALEEVLGTEKQWDAFNLSDIFEYMDSGTFSEQAELLLRTARTGALFAYWNLMVPRRMSAIFPQQVEYQEERSKKLTELDTGFFYNCLIIDRLND